MFSVSSDIASPFISLVAQGNDLSVTDNGSACTKSSDMAEREGLFILLAASADELHVGKDLHTDDTIVLPDGKAGTLVGSVSGSL